MASLSFCRRPNQAKHTQAYARANAHTPQNKGVPGSFFPSAGFFLPLRSGPELPRKIKIPLHFGQCSHQKESFSFPSPREDSQCYGTKPALWKACLTPCGVSCLCCFGTPYPKSKACAPALERGQFELWREWNLRSTRASGSTSGGGSPLTPL